MNKTIKSILSDLYKLDPELKNSEKDLIPLLEKLVESKPDLKLDEGFVKNLRNQLMARTDELMETERPSQAGWFSKILAPLMGTGAILAALVIGLMVWNGNLVFVPKSGTAPTVTRLAERDAFGPLAAETMSEAAQATGGYTKTIRVPKKSSSSKAVAKPAPETPSEPLMAAESADAAVSSPSFDRAATPVPAPMAAPSKIGIGGGGVASPGYNSLSIWVPYVYKYVYKGEPIVLKKTTVPVFKRVFEKAEDSALVKLLSKAGFGLIDLARLKGLSLENATLSQDSDQSYIINIDFVGNAVSLQPKWNTWLNPATECNGDTECLNRTQIKLADYPGDETVVQWAEKFFAEYGIDRSVYGKPVIQKFWEDSPEAAIDVLPDEVYMAYPLLVEGLPAYDTSGVPFGLLITANLRFKKIAGVSNLMLPRFESSEYEAVQNFAEVLKYAEEGPNPWKPEGEFKTLEVELGTPEKIMASVWMPSKDPNGPGTQVFVPALKFPITKKPKEEPYFWQKAVIVPLAKEMLN